MDLIKLYPITNDLLLFEKIEIEHLKGLVQLQ